MPDDPCPRPHRGYVVESQIRVTDADREETVRAGALRYLPTDHTPLVEEDVEFVEFSRPAEHEPVSDVVERNAAAAAS